MSYPLLVASQIIILIFSAIIHEYMHAWMAERQGDNTAKQAGRLTINPLAHIDLIGSIIVPLLLIIAKSPYLIGWAKPVPVNPNNFRDPKWGDIKVSAAGPLGNLITALFFGLILRFFTINNVIILEFFSIAVLLNLLLMIFNLIPIPPLDGSHILRDLLPLQAQIKFDELSKYSIFLLIFFVFFGIKYLWPIIYFLFTLITGYQ